MRRVFSQSHVAGAVAAALLAVGAQAHGAGFELYEQSPQGTAMAGANVAKADDASAVFYNPAGMAMMDGGSAMIGGAYATQGFQLTTAGMNPTTVNSQQGNFFLPTVYLTQHIGRYVAVGFGAFTQYGAGVDWTGGAQPFPGRFVVDKINLETVTLNPAIAFRPVDFIAFAAGLDVTLGSLDYTRGVQFADQEGTARVGGSGTTVGFNVGVLVKVVPRWLQAGFSYRSGSTMDADLLAHFEAPLELKDQVYDQKGKTSLVFPHNFTLGLAAFPLRNLTITADVHVTLWSDFQELAVTFPDGKTPGFSSYQGWKDEWSVRVGGEYLIGPVALRLGLGYEAGAIPLEYFQPSVPVGDKVLVAGGVGYKFRGFGVGVGYMAGITLQAKSTYTEFPATYSTGVGHIVNVALSYEWGRKPCEGCCAHCAPSGGDHTGAAK